MNIADCKPNDIVRCDVRGVRFYAIVEKAATYDKELKRRIVRVNSICGKSIPTHLVGARQIVSHWRKSSQSRQ